jgi:hypothetical protein
LEVDIVGKDEGAEGSERLAREEVGLATLYSGQHVSISQVGRHG